LSVHRNADQENLTALRRKGVKVLTYFGWEDQALSAMEAVRYYQGIARAMGGVEKTRDSIGYSWFPRRREGAAPGPQDYDSLIMPSARGTLT
jgi:hypothetical protein